LAITCVAAALEDAGLSPADLKDQTVGIIIGNSMGGETTDRYAERVSLPRTLSCLDRAFRSANIAPETREAMIEEFRTVFLSGLPDITEDSLPGELANVISGRVANVFNLVGPNFTVDAACASSMAAVMNAMAALRAGTVDYAVTGGVDAAMHPSSFVKFCKIGALSPDGSRPFDESANGFVMGEGAGMLVLKRLSDAERDGDRIYGTIVAVGSSSDGRGKGITAPNARGQERAIRACFDSSGISPSSIGLVEAHGTSTAVGDKTELIVLDEFFRGAGLKKGAVGIGSVKSQIGHLKAASGAAGMIKALLSLYHRKLPPTANVKKPNPCIDWESSPVFLVTKEQPWKSSKEHPRRVAVSAFGFGGTNFHIILQEHVPGLHLISSRQPARDVVTFVAPPWPCPPDMNVRGEAWIVGGEDTERIAATIASVLQDLTAEDFSLLAARCREDASERGIRYGFAAQDAEEAKKKLSLINEAVADPEKQAFLATRGIHLARGDREKGRHGVAFLFPGQGSQYPFMLRDLAERYPVVAETLAEADEILEQLGCPPVTETIFPATPEFAGKTEAEGDAMKDTQLLQPMILAANTAIFRLLGQFGVHPVACAGHSLGEYAACVAAGVFSFRDGLEAVAVRGREMARVSIADPGLMMSIPADARVVEEVLGEVDGYVVAANKNSPSQTVISGETAAVKAVAALFKARGLEGVLLPVSAAFHSGVVAPAREPFMKTLERLTVNPPSVPVIANVTGDFYPIGPAAPERIRDLLGKQFAAPVEWVKSLRRFYSEGIRVFVECGPKRVMTNLALDTLPDDVLALPTNHPRKGGVLQLQEALAVLAAEGVAVNWDGPEKGQTISERRERPALRIVAKPPAPVPDPAAAARPSAPHPLEDLLDAELREIAAQKEFSRFLELQGEPIRDLIKSGFRSFAKNILPMERTIRQVTSEGMDFQPVVVSGLSAGLPSDVRLPFELENLDDLIMGRNFIKKVPE
ncbi:MAG: type I polyketide synthase, partial [Acidobacteriota bacterium]